jgi:hypothetical protein
MNMNDDLLLENRDMNDCLRIHGNGSQLAPEIYISVSDNSELYAIHPLDFHCGRRMMLTDWPTPQLWREIFYLFGIHDEFSFCEYVHKISGGDILKKRHGFMHDLLQSFGYSEARFGDIGYTACLKGYKKKLFTEKKVPVKSIRLLDNVNDILTQNFCGFLVLKEVNGNIAREMIQHWIDLTDLSKKEVLLKFENISAGGSSDSKLQIQEQFRKIIYDARFPEINAWKNEFELRQNQLSRAVKVGFDVKFESSSFRIYADIENKQELNHFIDAINENKNILILEQMINLLNQA